ncbi:MAG: primosomal protein N' [Actinomycetota bacterium]|nr:primosomal protein N' [Actinomycetota bacterium]MDD5667448.1 primosomal protein N' [Actinomycetota bacterium]
MPGSNELKEGAEAYVNVVIDAPARQLDRPFTYSVPRHLAGKVETGSVALVPLGSTLQIGYVLDFCDPPDLPRVRAIEAVVDEPPLFDTRMVRLCEWMAHNYLSPLSQVFRLVVPPGRSRRVIETVALEREAAQALEGLPARAVRQREVVEALAAHGEMPVSELKSRLGGRISSSVLRALEEGGWVERRFVMPRPRASRIKVRVAMLTETGREAVEDHGRQGLSQARLRLLEALRDHGGSMTVPELLHATGSSSSVLRGAAEKGLLVVGEEERLRDPFAQRSFPSMDPHELNAEQRKALDEITASMKAGKSEVFLLHGITGSGKTEVYLYAIEYALRQGRTSVVLVPEIALTPQMVQRFKGRLGEEVAVLHSRLGLGERYDQWRGIRRGKYKVVIGARSALFAPLPDLGLIIIDEEHETTYKENSAPRYNAREVAAERARLSAATLVLGSATPQLESRYAAARGDYVYLELARRVDNRPLPEVEVVDMRDPGDAGMRTILSPRLVNALGKVYRAGEQAILFLNRRGFARFMQCHACGNILQCRNCSVSLCYHARGERLLCHHCGWTLQPPFVCPACGGPVHRYTGVGTERVEEELRRLLPPLRCIRMDADTTRRKDSHWDMLEDFKSGHAQVLLGTQMIAKGLDIPNVTLVGVINADTSLGLPDFRAGERTFQLLTQVGGRAGRGARPGKVIVQTFNPDHYAIRAAVRGDASAFYRKETEYRREANYPPFCRLVNLVISAPAETHARDAAHALGDLLRPRLRPGDGDVLGPAPAPLSRLKGRFRYHIVVKTTAFENAAAAIEDSLRDYDTFRNSYCRRERVPREDISLAVDVDPVTLL